MNMFNLIPIQIQIQMGECVCTACTGCAGGCTGCRATGKVDVEEEPF